MCKAIVFDGFFFFKHKTAYEMRISDWSSDVCSSDLGRADTAPSCDCRRDRPGPDLKRNPMRKTLLASTCLATLLSTAAHAETTIATATTAPVRTRSEEHTSELQSLMRISYAVFCLTKKKRNDGHTMNTHKQR